MAGNERRPGARRSGAKKGAQVGTGGHGRRALRGKGPTPKAEERTYHPAHKRRAQADKAKAAGQAREERRARSRTGVWIARDHDVVAGRNAVAEAVDAGLGITRLFVVPQLAQEDRVAALMQDAGALGAQMVEVTRHDLDDLTDGATHQGIAAELPPFEYVTLADLLDRAQEAGHPALIVALDGVTDPHNLGAVLRSAGAFGADGVLIPERRSAAVNTAAWKVSAGAAARVPVARETNLVRALKEAQRAGLFVAGLDGGGDVEIGELHLADGPLVLVTGAEGSGLSRLVRETCDVLVSVPITDQVESLNAAVATGISLYEVARRRRAAEG